MDVVLSIAGSDSSAGAGIQADLKAIAACGGYGVTALTAITAQNTRGVQASAPVGTTLLRQQLESLFSDVRIGAAKTGMLANAEQVQTVADFLRRHKLVNLVVDPVMVSTSGALLLENDAIEVMRRELLPLATVVTPNRHELAVLADQAIDNMDEAVTAARQLIANGVSAVLITGGHFDESEAADLLVTSQSTQRFAARRVATLHTHGTGCTLSAALATYLAHGLALADAVAAAKGYVTEALRDAIALGQGHGPTDHFYYMRREDPAAALQALQGLHGSRSVSVGEAT